jgi:hypothetical protein
MRQQSGAPTRKVMAGGVAGAITTIVVFILNYYVLPQDKPITGDIGAAITTVLSFVVCYLVPPAAADQIRAD